MNNSGSGASAIIARHDYLPFCEEIWAGVGLRTTAQKYATTDKVRQRFALLSVMKQRDWTIHGSASTIAMLVAGPTQDPPEGSKKEVNPAF